MNLDTNKIIMFKSSDGQVNFDVQVDLNTDTVWLNQSRIVDLFERDQSVISRHIRAIFNENELEQKSSMQKMHIANSDKPVAFYSLDVIISVGYRVKSKRGIEFRKWATSILKKYMLEGYALNQKKLTNKEIEIQHLKKGIQLLRSAMNDQVNSLENSRGMSELLHYFSTGLEILDDYDHENLDKNGKHSDTEYSAIEYDEFKAVLTEMKAQAESPLFAQEKDNGFKSAVAQMYQSFGGKELYPSIEEKAAILLYLIVKNHAFVDGNKRIGAACFVYFLDRHHILLNEEGDSVIGDYTLATLTLFIAASRPDDMDTVLQLILSVLNR